ncbi:MFS transporter [Halenospora varia]|nr:MFS transporter [Halenospora varia]
MDAKSDLAAKLEHGELPSSAAVEEIPRNWANRRLVMNLIIIGLGLSTWGYDNNFVSPLLSLPLFIARYQGPDAAFTARNLDLIVTVPLVGAFLGALGSSPLMVRFGRKNTLVLAYIFCCLPGSFLQLFAPNLAALVIGRFWNYVGISVLTTNTPLYLSELVPVHVRARAVGFCVAGTAATGVIATAIVWGTEKINNSLQYRIPLAIQAGLPGLLAILTLLCTESPTWLALQGRTDEARNNLAALRPKNEALVQAEFAHLLVAVNEDKTRRAEAKFWDILNKKNIKRTMTAGALLPLYQVSGIILSSTYSTVILVQSRVSDPFRMTIVLNCLAFIGVIVGPTMQDIVGRRPVALVGFTIMMLLDFAAGGLACAGLTTEHEKLALAGMVIVFTFFANACFNPLCWLIPTEISAPSLREPTMAWALIWSYTTAVITTFAVPQITSADAGNLGAKAFLIFGGCMVVIMIFIYFYLPETKGRALDEIDEMYTAGVPMRKWSHYQCQNSSSARATGYEKE